MNMNSLFNRLENERAALEHPQAVDRFLRETEYLRAGPAHRRLSDSKARWTVIIVRLGVVSILAVATFNLLH